MSKLSEIETPLLVELVNDERRRRYPGRHWVFASALCVVGFCVSLLVGIVRLMARREEYNIGSVVPLLWCFLIPAVFCSLVVGVLQWRHDRFQKEMMRRLGLVPKRLVEDALRRYGPGTSGEYPYWASAIECDECHLPGDCPLCGAE